MEWAAVIVAAGKSRRAGFDKLLAPLAGVPVLCHSVRAFAAAGARSIVVVCPAERWSTVDVLEDIRGVELRRVDGGRERQDSVRAGLAALPAEAEWVAVHDAARPLITPDGIRTCLRAAMQNGAAACAHPIVDTLKRADAAGVTLPEELDRNGLWGMETPQIFRTQLLREAYEVARQRGAQLTDEVSAVQLLGVQVQLVQVGENMKITLPGDCERAELVIRSRGCVTPVPKKSSVEHKGAWVQEDAGVTMHDVRRTMCDFHDGEVAHE